MNEDTLTTEEFPTNSKNSNKTQYNKKAAAKTKDEAPPSKDIQKVVEGQVTVRKPTMKERFKNSIVKGEIKGAATYIVQDVALPAVRNLIVDAATQGIERMIYGEARTPRNRRPSGGSGPRVTYGGFVNRQQPQIAQLPDQAPRYINGGTRSRGGQPAPFTIPTRADAEAVAEQMLLIVERYGSVSVADMNELVGMPFDFTDHKWGWSALGDIRIQQTRDGFYLELPPVEPIQS